MVPKLACHYGLNDDGFRAVLFRMVPKHIDLFLTQIGSFRAVLFRMVPKH